MKPHKFSLEEEEREIRRQEYNDLKDAAVEAIEKVIIHERANSLVSGEALRVHMSGPGPVGQEF